MRTLCYYDIPGRRLLSDFTNGKGSEFRLPVLASGQDLTLAVRFVTKNGVGTLEETFPVVKGVRGLIGETGMLPESGQLSLNIEAAPSSSANTTEVFEWNAGADRLKALLNEVSGEAFSIDVEDVEGGWLIWREDGGELKLSTPTNTMQPVTFAWIRGWTDGAGRWSYEVRPSRAPLSFAGNWERVDPEAPSVSTLQDGYLDPSGTYFQDEVQLITFPSEFRGGGYLYWPSRFARSQRIDTLTTSEGIQEAMGVMLKDGERVRVEDSQTLGEARIYFEGDLSGVDIEELQFVVTDAPPGDVTFSFSLKRPELYAALRASKSGLLEEVPFELEFDFVKKASDLVDETAKVDRQKTAGMVVNLRRERGFDSLAERAGMDWLRPAQATNFLNFYASQIVDSPLGYVEEEFGNGADLNFAIDHNLGTPDIAKIMVRENGAGGKALTEGVDFEAVFDSDNSLTLSFVVAPGVNALRAIVVTAGQAGLWRGHLHDTLQIYRAGVPLNDILDSQAAAILELQNRFPSADDVAVKATSGSIEILIPEVSELLHHGLVKMSDQGEVDAELPRVAPYLLPAVHDASVSSFDQADDPLPDLESDDVWINETGKTLRLPTGGRIRRQKVENAGHFASDGRTRYPVTKKAGTNSFYSDAFERDVFKPIFVNSAMLAVNGLLSINFGLRLGLVADRSSNLPAAQWVVVVETGVKSADASPAPIGVNIDDIVWSDTAILTQEIVLTNTIQPHSFGVRIRRLADSWKVDAQKYNVWSANNAAAPASADFAVRARLVQFDIEDDVENPKGWVFRKLFGSQETDSAGNTTYKPPKAIIT